MMHKSPSPETLTFVLAFLVLYLFFLLKNTLRNKIDLFDLILLSTVALIPAGFVFFSDIAYKLADLIGVAFPFVLLFGSLFFLIFVCLYRLIKRINMLTYKNINLIQELSLLKNELDQKTENNLP